jgi:hypothetical protein
MISAPAGRFVATDERESSVGAARDRVHVESLS